MNRLLPITAAAFIVASVAIFLFGDSGLSAFDSLEQYEQALEANVQALQHHHQDLQAELERLQTDPDRIRVLAHGIGMYEPGEEVVKIVGRPPRAEGHSVGDLLRMKRPAPTRNALVKEAALGASLVLLAVSLVVSRAQRRKNGGPSRR